MKDHCSGLPPKRDDSILTRRRILQGTGGLIAAAAFPRTFTFGVRPHGSRSLRASASRPLRCCFAPKPLPFNPLAERRAYVTSTDSISRRPASRRSDSSSICLTRSRVRPRRRPISSSVCGSAPVSP